MTIFSLSGKTAVVTGGGGRLGFAIAVGLASAGAHVHVIGRSEEPIERVVGRIVQEGGEATAHAFDVTDSGKLEEFCERVAGPVHVLVNNAYGGSTGTLEDARADNFEKAFDVGCTAPAEFIRMLLPKLRSASAQSGDASVINIASMYGKVSPNGAIYGTSGMNSPPYYGAAKAALIQYTRYAACHLAPSGVRVNTVSPGPFPPPEFRESKPAFFNELVSRVPLGRIGLPEDLVGPVLFLASPASKFVTGTDLTVDGGWTSW